jgi:hypothetical protein
MKRHNRDLLVMLKQELMSPQAMELEVMKLHDLLHRFERPANIIPAYEVLDMVHYRIGRKYEIVRRYMREPDPKPFIFFVNRN